MSHLGQLQKFFPKVAHQAEHPSFSFKSNDKQAKQKTKMTQFAVSAGAMVLDDRKNNGQ